MACVQCGRNVRVYKDNGLCESCGEEKKKEAMERLKNASPSEKAALAGAATGAAIGSVVPFIGTVVGGVIGAFIGSALGSDD